MCIFLAHFQYKIKQSQEICNQHFTEQFTLLATLSSDSIHGNYCGNSISVCVYFFFLLLYLSLISNLHLTPSWGKASHSSTVFVPVTSRVPPAYQYQLRQCWACNLQLNVILLNPIWKLNIEKPLAYLPVFLPLLLAPLLATIPPAFCSPSLPFCSCFAPCVTFVLFCLWVLFMSHNGYLVELILNLCHRKK